MKKILIADDHSAIRNGVKLILKNEYNEIEFGEASNAIEIFKKLKETNWDILILDMDMPGKNGLEVLKQLKDEGNKIPVLVFSMHPEEQIAIRSLKSGAQGYLSKDAASEELSKAVTQILSGRRFITASLAEQLAYQLENPSGKSPHELLSDREYQTMLLIASGKTVSQIAEKLTLSVPTVSTYRIRILEKMNLKNNAEITYYVISNRLSHKPEVS